MILHLSNVRNSDRNNYEKSKSYLDVSEKIPQKIKNELNNKDIKIAKHEEREETSEREGGAAMDGG